MEAVHGTTRDVTFTADAECRSCNATGSSDGKAPGICKTCNGSGTVRIKFLKFSIFEKLIFFLEN